jgi:hypothetical protein
MKYWGLHWRIPVDQMEPRRAVRIWARTKSATRPSVNVQSVPSFLAASHHVKAENRNKKNEDQDQPSEPSQLVLDCVGSPCKYFSSLLGLEAAWRSNQWGGVVCSRLGG